MTHVTCRLTAKNRDQLRNPTLSNRVWATFTFLCMYKRPSFAAVTVKCRPILRGMVVMLTNKRIDRVTNWVDLFRSVHFSSVQFMCYATDKPLFSSFLGGGQHSKGIYLLRRRPPQSTISLSVELVVVFITIVM